MSRIVTLTLNPSVDLATSVDVVQAEHKLRCRDTSYDPGGGGINVARVVHELGGAVVAAWTCGGAMGDLLKTLLDRCDLQHAPIPIAEPVRQDVTVLESRTNAQYRFVLEGPVLSSAEASSIMRFVEDYRPA